mgnify:CR=1 FL=1
MRTIFKQRVFSVPVPFTDEKNVSTEPVIDAEPLLEVRHLTMKYNRRVIQQNLDFRICRGQVFVIMGGSGCGKSTLLRHLTGLQKPASGEVWFEGENFWKLTPSRRDDLMRQAGVLFQRSGLWSSMTLAENIALPLREYTSYSAAEIRELCEWKLSLVGLAGFGGYYPSEISGGMQKRAGLARAIALDPKVVFFDEPSAGLDPVNASRLDDLILELRESLGATVVVVTHELASIFAIADEAIFLDGLSKTIIARGKPRDLKDNSQNPTVREFLTRRGKNVEL